MSFEEQAAAWIEWAQWPLDAYWFYREGFFELAEQRPATRRHRWQRMPNFVTIRASRRPSPRP